MASGRVGNEVCNTGTAIAESAATYCTGYCAWAVIVNTVNTSKRCFNFAIGSRKCIDRSRESITTLAGIYLHIPFCRQACHYCNFHFSTSLRYRDEVVAALETEVALQHPFLNGETVDTIYFGGGTPSLLSIDECRRLMDAVRKNFTVAADAEVTLEANPDDIDGRNLAGWKEAGINRFSIGIQSFFEQELRWMNRAHNAEQARRCIEETLAAGFTNFSIDLIYGSPLLTDQMWEQNVARALEYRIPHLSCYALTVEEKTPLHRMIRMHKKQEPDADNQARQFLLLMQWLQAASYEHYEVSNFARPGFRSRHNSAYWQGKPYLGIGPSAHSYNGRQRFWNIANNAQYVRLIGEGSIPHEKEELTDTQRLNEYLMISLRTREGVDTDFVASAWGPDKAERVLKRSDRYIQNNLLIYNKPMLQLNNQGMLMADGIAAALFF
jgi:oxygen-independent coproporphyrinogen III oxidase